MSDILIKRCATKSELDNTEYIDGQILFTTYDNSDKIHYNGIYNDVNGKRVRISGKDILIDSEVSKTSTNSVENQAITNYVDNQVGDLETQFNETKQIVDDFKSTYDNRLQLTVTSYSKEHNYSNPVDSAYSGKHTLSGKIYYEKLEGKSKGMITLQLSVLVPFQHEKTNGFTFQIPGGVTFEESQPSVSLNIQTKVPQNKFASVVYGSSDISTSWTLLGDNRTFMIETYTAGEDDAEVTVNLTFVGFGTYDPSKD